MGRKATTEEVKTRWWGVVVGGDGGGEALGLLVEREEEGMGFSQARRAAWAM